MTRFDHAHHGLTFYFRLFHALRRRARRNHPALSGTSLAFASLPPPLILSVLSATRTPINQPLPAKPHLHNAGPLHTKRESMSSPCCKIQLGSPVYCASFVLKNFISSMIPVWNQTPALLAFLVFLTLLVTWDFWALFSRTMLALSTLLAITGIRQANYALTVSLGGIGFTEALRCAGISGAVLRVPATPTCTTTASPESSALLGDSASRLLSLSIETVAYVALWPSSPSSRRDELTV